MMLVLAGGGFSIGGLALHGGSLVEYGVAWAIVFLMVGSFEELLFRGYRQFTLTAAIGFWPSAILLSIVFGFVYLGDLGENWVGGATAALFGLFLCFTLRRTGNLWFALCLHASFVYGETFVYSVPNSGFPLLRTLAQFYSPRPTMVDGRISRPGGQRDDVCRTRPLVHAVRGFRAARNKPLTGVWMNRIKFIGVDPRQAITRMRIPFKG